MRTAREIYEQYRVPPWLQEHQVRVAAVGKMTAAARDDIDIDLTVRTCLLHDIGAIVKFDFSSDMHPDLRKLVPAHDVARWVAIQDDTRKRYGLKEYAASRAIIQEIGSADVQRVFDSMGLQNMPRILADNLKEAQAAQYADLRVGPNGILPIRERMADIATRYASYWEREGRTEESKRYPADAVRLEEELFKEARISPHDINDLTIRPLIEELWDYRVA